MYRFTDFRKKATLSKTKLRSCLFEKFLLSMFSLMITTKKKKMVIMQTDIPIYIYVENIAYILSSKNNGL